MKENNNIDHYYLPENTILDGRYRILRVLGMGGFGITYEAVNEKVNRHVAVKEFCIWNCMTRRGLEVTVMDKAEGEYFRSLKANFLKEARRLGDFSTEPGIVHVLDYFEANNTAYIVMEYVGGITLARYLEENGLIDAKTMFRLLIPLMETLDKVHKNGVIHRDISPDNIKLIRSESGELSVKLLDFGSAREYIDNETYTIELKNGYAPLEQYSNSEQGPWTDVYALCAVIYRGITGEKPVSATVRAMNEKLTMPSQRAIKIDPRLERILKKGLSLNREDRYQTIGELLSDLKQVIEPEKKKTSRKGGRIFLGVSCAVCILGAALWGAGNYYSTHRAFFKFHGKETAVAFLMPYDNVGARAYQKDINTIKNRLDIAFGSDNYIPTELEDGMQIEIPVEIFEKRRKSDNQDQTQTLEEYIMEYMTETVAAAHRKAVTVIEPYEDGSYDIIRETLKEDDILSVKTATGKLPIEYYIPEDIKAQLEETNGYVKIELAQAAAKKMKENLQIHLQSGTGDNRSYMWITTDPCYPESQNYAFCTDPDGDWSTYYAPVNLDNDRWKLLWEDAQLSETYQVLREMPEEKELQTEKEVKDTDSQLLKNVKALLTVVNEDAEAEEKVSTYSTEIDIRLNRNIYGEEYGTQTVADVEALLKDLSWLTDTVYLQIYPGSRTAGEHITLYPGSKKSGKEWKLQYAYTDDSDLEQQKIMEEIKNSDILKQYLTDDTFTYAAW